MGNTFKKSIAGFLVLITASLILTVSVSAYESSNMQFYFSPQVMNDVSGEVTVGVNMRNFSIAVPKHLGDLCGFTFRFTFDDEQFTLNTDASGKPVILLDDKTLVREARDIEAKVEGNQITVEFMDGTLGERLIHSDGTLFRFRLTALQPRVMWNSAEYYPLRFVPGTLGAVTYRTDTDSVGRYDAAEGIDGRVGGYNVPQAILPQPVGKSFVFVQGSTQVSVDGVETDMDVPVMIQDGKTMIPMRFLAENANMKVDWDGEAVSAGAYVDCRTLRIFAASGRVYLNSVPLKVDAAPIVRGDRIYITADTVRSIWKGASITEADDKIVVNLP